MVAEGIHHAQVSFPTPLVTKITTGMASLLISWSLEVMNSILAFPHIAGDNKPAKSLSNMILNQRAPKNGRSQTDIHSFLGNGHSKKGSSTISW